MAKNSVSEITSLSDQAIDWVIVLNSGTAIEQDKLLAEQWQSRSPSHRKAYLEAEQLWLEMGVAIQPIDSVPKPPVIAVKHRRKSRYWPRNLAAASIAVALILPFTGLTDRWLSDYATAVGEQKTVTLADGSQVILNTDTALSVAYTATGRYLTLKHGQAVFKVAADRNRPFEVATDTSVVKALGTVFDVQEESHGTRITVEEHVVGVKGLHDQDYSANARIHAGQQAVYTNAHGLEAAVTIDAKQSSAWQRGKLIFKSQPLAEVTAELNRYFPGRIQILDGGLATLRVSGVFPINDQAATLNMIEQLLPLKITRVTPWLTLLHG